MQSMPAMDGAGNQAETSRQKPVRFLRILWRRKVFLACAALLLAAAGMAMLDQIESTYVARALVKLNGPDNGGDQVDTDPADAQPQAARIESPAMAQKLADRLQLHMLPEFNPRLRDDGLWQKLPGFVVERLPSSLTGGLAAAGGDRPMTDEEQASLLQSVIGANVQAAIAVEPAVEPFALEIAFTSTDPMLAQLGANTLAEIYADEGLAEARGRGEAGRQALEDEVRRMRIAVVEGEQAIQRYRTENGLVGLPDAAQVEARISSLTTELIVTRGELALAEEALRDVGGLRAGEVEISLTGELEGAAQQNELLRQENALREQIAALETQGDNDPKLLDLRRELDALHAERMAALDQLETSLRDRTVFLREQAEELARSADQLKSLLAAASPEERELAALERETEAARKLLDSYTDKIAKITIGEPVGGIESRIVQAASRPSDPVYPPRSLLISLIMLGALTVGSLAVIGIDAMDKTIKDPAGITAATGLPVAGVIPAVGSWAMRHGPLEEQVVERPDSPFADMARALESDLFGGALANHGQIILLTSSCAGEGTSSLVLALARTAALAGRRTLLIDCNLRRPRLHEISGLDNEIGLIDVLAGDRTLEEVMHLDERSGAMVVAAGGISPESADLLSSGAMRRILEELGDFPLVLLDSPPVLEFPDAKILGSMVDRVAYVARWGKTREDQLVAGVSALQAAGAELAGVILGQVPGRHRPLRDETPSAQHLIGEAVASEPAGQ